MRYTGLNTIQISQAIEELSTYLTATTLGKEDRIRTVFAMEEALLNYQDRFSDEVPFVLTCGSKWGKEQFSVTIQGGVYNPFEQEEDPEFPSITCSICNMGDIGTFGKIGKHTILAMLKVTCVITVVSCF